MRVLYINYDLWKSIVDGKGLTVYEQPLDATSCHLWAGAADIVYRSNVEAAGFSAYETDFPAGPTRVAVADEDEALARIIGLVAVLPNQVIAPAFEDTGGVSPQWVSNLYTVQAGALNFFDRAIIYEEKLRRGWYEVMDTNSVIGDYIEESVIDKDDVLGYFGAYGYTVGVDVLELVKYVKTDYINPLAAGTRQNFEVGSVFAIMPGLYLRTAYLSTGANNIQLKVATLAYF